MNVPKLRFKEFNDEWKNKILSDAVLFLDDKRKPIKDSDRNIIKGKYPYYGASGIIDYINDYIFDEDLLLLGEDGANIISRSTKLVFKASGKYWVNNHAHVLKPYKNSNINFLEFYLENINYEPFNTGTAQPKLNQEVCKRIPLKIPSLQEQEKIGTFLSLLDKKIELQSKKIEDLKLYKLSLREKLFYMFPTNNKKLSEILTKWNKKNRNNKYSYVESVSNKYGFIAQNEQFEDRNVASNDTRNYYVIEKGVFAYNPSRLNVGSLALKINDKTSLVSPLYECFTTNQNQYFMLEWFKSKEFRRETFSKYEGGVRNTLNFNNLLSIKINLPSIESQNEIVKVLDCYNKLIDLELNKLNKLQELKKGLMQQLFI